MYNYIINLCFYIFISNDDKTFSFQQRRGITEKSTSEELLSLDCIDWGDVETRH